MHNHHNDQLLHVEMTCGSLLFELQVTDFGLTKLTEVGSSSLHTRLVGTFGYMALEFQVILSGSTSVRGVLEDAGAAVFSSPINISNSAKEEENANFPGCRSSPALAETGLKGIGRVANSRKFLGDGLDWFDPIIGMPEDMKRAENSNLLFHVALTATDAPYSKWQCRIMYYWYKKVKDMPGSDIGGFTRVLHSGSPDNLMEEIPTFVVDPLPDGLDRGYIVLNRPWAFVQWLEKATIEEEYILMAEPDHIFVNPLPNLARGDYPAGFPFFYIKPAENEKIIRKYYPEEKGPVTNVDPIGNSPVIIKKSLLEKIAPTWMNISLGMKHDQETDKAFGWVLEM
ncbi:hypothetical protein F0562_001831 [Nyssa sinensis]|uniref:Hydroxyproline O-arabinosyltransferase-like domain-containing protein n=1 Tax=Nyssa sinensis TaxID=561372 RepID=A0A5J5C444_9ASTE|nr:hypothetical protein F0562_001831 [Nyssa sinensis]